MTETGEECLAVHIRLRQLMTPKIQPLLFKYAPHICMRTVGMHARCWPNDAFNVTLTHIVLDISIFVTHHAI